MPAAPLHNDPIPFITLPNWVKAAAQCGFNIEPIFRELGIQTDLVHLESATISQPVLEQVFEACMRRARRHHFPFVLGETFAFEYLPDLETFLTTSPTLREAARVFDWVRELINPMINLRLEEQGELAILVLEQGGEGAPRPRRWFADTVFASVVKFGRELLRQRARFQRLTLRSPAPRNARVYREYFQMPVVFGAARDTLEFDRRLLDLPLAGDFPALHRQAEYRVSQRIANLPRRVALATAIEDVLARKPQLLAAGIGTVAAELGLGARTLQRRLKERGESYADVLARVRYREAMRLLERAELAVDEVSERLGFSDRRAFTRAFTRWSGVSPSAFRSSRARA